MPSEAPFVRNAVDILLAPKAYPIVGALHLPPLVGPDAIPVDALLERVAADARAYHAAGFDAVLIENYGDAPFAKDRTPPHVGAVLARAVAIARQETGLPIGVNVLRNDTLAALGACYAGGGSFVRANVYTGATLTDQGIIEGNAYDVVRYRRELGRERGPDRMLILADVDVKHGTPLVHRPIEVMATEMVHRAKADVLLVTGEATGRPVDVADLERARRGAPGTPVWVASGATERSIGELRHVADGFIIGTAAKQGGSVRAPVDPERARRIGKAAGKTPPG